MQITVKRLKGTSFEIEAKPQDTVADVKKNIESVKGADVYPAARQMLIHRGKVLRDETTLEENKIDENGFIVVMLTKKWHEVTDSPAPVAAAAPPPTSVTAPAVVPSPTPEWDTMSPTIAPRENVSGQAASVVIQQIVDMGGGRWGRDTVVGALAAASNNPERAIEYLYSHPRVARYNREVDNFSLTVDEMDSIYRLEGMGFEMSLVIEVFLACEKNEEQAANYLLDHMDED